MKKVEKVVDNTKLIRAYTHALAQSRVNSGEWLELNDALNKLWVAEIMRKEKANG